MGDPRGRAGWHHGSGRAAELAVHFQRISTVMLLLYSPGKGPCNCTGQGQNEPSVRVLGMRPEPAGPHWHPQLTHSGTSVSARWDGAGRQGTALREIPPAPAPPTALSRQGHRVTSAPSAAAGPQGARPAAPVPRTPRGDRDPRSAHSHRAAGPLPPAAGARLDTPKHHGPAPTTPGPQGAPAPQLRTPPFPGRRAGLPDPSTGAVRTGTALIPAALPPLTSLSPVPPPSASRRVCR